MKFSKWILTTFAAAALALSGCNKQQNSVDTAPLEKSFSSAEPTLKSTADKAVADIKSSNFSGAMTELQKLAGQAKLTPEQQQAIKDVLAQLQKQVTDAVGKVGKDAEKTASDLQKSLPK